MTNVISTREISSHIQGIIKNAKEEILLITPYLKIDSTLFEWLKIADRRQVQITLVYGKDKLIPKQEKQLKELQNCKILFSKNLHAKVYLNENEGVIASMNLYEFSEINNFEIGVHFIKNTSDTIYEQTITEVTPILNLAKLEWESLKEKKQENEDLSISTFLESKKEDVSIKDFPIKGVSMDTSYGFATYNIEMENVDLEKVCKKYLPTFEKELGKSYRVYWKSPYTRIFLYDASSKKFKDDTHKKNYRAKAMRITNSLIKEFIEFYKFIF